MAHAPDRRLFLTMLALIASGEALALAETVRASPFGGRGTNARLGARVGRGLLLGTSSSPTIVPRAQSRALLGLDAAIVGNIPTYVPGKTPWSLRRQARDNNMALMRDGHHALAAALAARSAKAKGSDAGAKQKAKEARNILMKWASRDGTIGDPALIRDPKNNNAPLEACWFTSLVCRAATVLRDGHGDVFSNKDREIFTRWLKGVMLEKYVNQFDAGVSNRLASQLEAKMRVAAFEGNLNALKYLFHNPGEGFIRFLDVYIDVKRDSKGRVVAVRLGDRDGANGDSNRDYFHPQFGLASSLQIIALARHLGHGFAFENPLEKRVSEALALALEDTAKLVLHAADPGLYPEVAHRTKPKVDQGGSFDIPLWSTAEWYFTTILGREAPKPVVEMRKRARSEFSLSFVDRADNSDI